MPTTLPPAPEVQNRISSTVRRIEYGAWSSSGQPSAPVYVFPRSSGTAQLITRRATSLNAIAKQLLTTFEDAKNEDVSLSQKTLATAFGLLKTFDERIAPVAPHAPHITFSSDAEIVLEWRFAAKRLIFYVEDTSVTFLASWGSDIYREMDEGEIVSFYEVATKWRWLQNQK